MDFGSWILDLGSLDTNNFLVESYLSQPKEISIFEYLHQKICSYQNLWHSLWWDQFHLKRKNISMIYHPIKSSIKFKLFRYSQKSLKILLLPIFFIVISWFFEMRPANLAGQMSRPSQNKFKLLLLKSGKLKLRKIISEWEIKKIPI